jgi:dienelactone hydrolase
MNFLLQAMAKMPETTQDSIFNWLLKNGLLFRMNVFKMMMQTMVFFGADWKQLKAAFARGGGFGPRLIESFHELAEETRQNAENNKITGNLQNARKLYARGALYYLIADLFTYDGKEIAENYEKAIPCFDKYRALTSPPMENISFPFREGFLKAHLRLPEAKEAPFPAVILIQGNDTVKEWLVPFEDIASRNGIVTLSVDPPGWGESGLSGNRFGSSEDMRQCLRLCVDYLQKRNDVCPSQVGLFGFSFGGLLALYAAGLEARIAAVATLGAPDFSSINKLWRSRPLVQRRRGHRYTGHRTIKEREQWLACLRLSETIAQVKCPALFIHGSRDNFYPPEHAQKLADTVEGKTEIRVIEGGDHMCTQFLAEGLADEIFKWFRKTLIN